MYKHRTISAHKMPNESAILSGITGLILQRVTLNVTSRPATQSLKPSHIRMALEGLSIPSVPASYWLLLQDKLRQKQ